jgi:hypothetical protein
MDEAENRMETDGKGLFIIRNDQKVAKYEAGKWVPLLSGVVVRNHPMALKLKCRTRPPGTLVQASFRGNPGAPRLIDVDDRTFAACRKK